VAAILTLTAPGRRGFYRPLLIAATLLAFCVVGLGAYVRLSDAGLGCPDWPGCYGHLVGVPDTHAEQAAAAAAFPGKPVETHKAWKEMIHRYAAGTLGLLILGIAISAWRRERESRPWLETGLLALVVFQAVLGMWTVTLLLKPAIVTAHLLGGMATLALLALCLIRETKVGAGGTARRAEMATPALGLLALAAVVGQIVLGGWVSSNYAALACTDFPTCQGRWWPEADYANAFHVVRELGQTAEGGLLPVSALKAIHWSHRLGALLVLAAVGAYAMVLIRRRQRMGWWLAALLAAQVGLGIANVLLSLPLAVAVAHNLGAALLLTTLVAANFRGY